MYVCVLMRYLMMDVMYDDDVLIYNNNKIMFDVMYVSSFTINKIIMSKVVITKKKN